MVVITTTGLYNPKTIGEWRANMKIGMKLYVLVIVVALSGVVIGVAYNDVNPEMMPQQVHLEAETDKGSYELDENVNIEVKLINDDIKDSKFDFKTDHQYDLFIRDSDGNEVFNLFENYTAHNDPTNIMLPPKSEEVLLKKFTWNRADKSGRQVPPGNYTAYSKLIGYDISDERQIYIGEHREVYIKVTTDKNVYRLGENVKINAYLVNERNENLTLWFPGSCVLKTTKIYNSSGHLSFSSFLENGCVWAIGKEIVEPNGEWLLYYDFDWDQLNYKVNSTFGPWGNAEQQRLFYPQEYYSLGFTQVPPDVYNIEFVLADLIQEEPYSSWNTPLDYKSQGHKFILILSS